MTGIGQGTRPAGWPELTARAVERVMVVAKKSARFAKGQAARSVQPGNDRGKEFGLYAVWIG